MYPDSLRNAPIVVKTREGLKAFPAEAPWTGRSCGRGGNRLRHLLTGAAFSVLSLGLMVASVHAQTVPSGGTVVSGTATITTNGTSMIIQQDSQRAVIDWQDFSVGENHLVEFLQGSNNAAVLNRVISNIPSHILGRIRADGNVYVVNPNGIIIGQGAQINANSFIASALNLSADQFMAGGDLNFSGESAAGVINLGEINAGQGDVYLIARQVTNKGAIRAPQGEVGLAAGTEVFLSVARGANGSRITVKANESLREALKSGAAVDNGGVIEAARVVLAAGGNDIYDMAINNSGTIRATGLSKNADGTIRLVAAKGTNSKVVNSGALIATNKDDTGGTVNVLGDHITLKSGSLIDVSAPKGGGEVLVGGDYKGGNAIQTAETVTMEQGATIKASATDVGDGGRVILWADNVTVVAGTIESTGGAHGGNGGFVETSGKNNLKIEETARVLVGANNADGRGGEWLLDPSDILIADVGGDVLSSTINSTLNGGGNVTIETNAVAAGNGDITLLNAHIDKNQSNNDARLLLRAHRNITMTDSTIASSGGDALSVLFNSAASGTGGSIAFTNSTITTNGGHVVLGGGLLSAVDTDGNGILGDGGTGLDMTASVGVSSAYGIALNNADIMTGAGDIVMNGWGRNTVADSSQYGISIINGATFETTSGTIRLTGTGGAGAQLNDGIRLSDSTLRTQNGGVVLTGIGGSGTAAGSVNNRGILLANTQILSTGTGAAAGDITLIGTGGMGEDQNQGIHIITGSVVRSVDGKILLKGNGGSNTSAASTDNYGIGIFNTTIESTGASARGITIDGAGGGGDDVNYGVYINTSFVNSVTGDILITGEGGSNGLAGSDQNRGLRLFASKVESTGTGANAASITLNGRGAAGTSENTGVLIGLTDILSIDGDISITGEGGSNNLAGISNNGGVHIQQSGNIMSLGTGAGAAKITINGTGGAGDGNNRGVRVEPLAAGAFKIESGYGDITITGRGDSNGTGSANQGVYLYGASTIQSTGVGTNAAKITLDGIGGAGDDTNYGVVLSSNGALLPRLESVDGDITITGRGGSNGLDDSNTNAGISLINARILSTGITANAAKITLDGTGGAGGLSNWGVISYTGTILESGYGDIAITGRGGSNGSDASMSNIGVVMGLGRTISTGTGADAATITLTGTGGAGYSGGHGLYFENSASVESIDGDITFTGYGASNGRAGGNNNSGVHMRGSAASQIEIKSTGTGADAAKITITGTGGIGEDTNYGVYGLYTNIESSYGDIAMAGYAGSNYTDLSRDNYGLAYIESKIRSIGTGADAATITLHGTGGMGQLSNHGIVVSGSTALIESFDGDIVITGQGGSNRAALSSGNHGIRVQNGAVIRSAGTTADAAKITFNGTAGAGETNNYGIHIINGGTVESGYGDITMTGRGGSNATADADYAYGIVIESIVRSTGTGANAANITMTGYGATAKTAAYGILQQGNLSVLESIDGDITLTGYAEGGAVMSVGVVLSAGNVRTTGVGAHAGNILITGTGSSTGTGESRGLSLGAAGTTRPLIISTADGDITFVSKTTNNNGAGLRMGDMTIETTGIGADINFVADRLVIYYAMDIRTADGDVSFTTLTPGTEIRLGSGYSPGRDALILPQSYLNYINAGGRIVIGDPVNGINTVNINGLDVFSRDYDIYGGAITARNLMDLDGSSSTFVARTGNLTLFDDNIFGAGATLDEVKANFHAVAGDLILAPTAAAGSIGINGGAGTHTLSAAALAGFTQIGRNLIIGDPTAGAGVVSINTGGTPLNLSGETYGLGFYGNQINLNGNITTGRDLILAANTFNWGAYTLSAQRDIVLKTQTASFDIGVSGGTGTIQIDDALISRLFPALGGTGNLVIGESNGGSGFINIDGLDLSAQSYGLEFYGGRINLLNNAPLASGRGLVLAADTLSTGTSAIRARSGIDLRHMTAGRTIQFDETAGKIQYNFIDQVALGQLDYDSDSSGGDRLTVGSTNSGAVTWTTTTADLNRYNFRTGGGLTVVNSNAGTSYGLGDGTTGDIHWTTAQMLDLLIGGVLTIGNAASGTGAVQIADFGAGYGLNASGGTIQIGAWNAGTNNIALNARTGGITTNGGLMKGGAMTLNSAGGTVGTFNTDVASLNYTVGGNLSLREANALTITGGVATGAGTVDIRTTDGDLTINNGLTMRGDTLMAAGGKGSIYSYNPLTSHATGTSSLIFRADNNISLYTGSHITNSNGQTLNVILNSDRDQNRNGRITVSSSNIMTNGGDFIAGGGLDPETENAWADPASNSYGVTLYNTNIVTGSGDIRLTGHGGSDPSRSGGYGMIIYGDSVLNAHSGQIVLTGTGGATRSAGYGVVLGSGTPVTKATITSAYGDIVINGTGGYNMTSQGSMHGVYLISGSTISSTGTGANAATIRINGTGVAANSAPSNYGVVVTNGAGVTSVDGDITITGSVNSENWTRANSNMGIYLTTGVFLRSTGTTADAAKITLTGTGGAGGNGNYGVYFISVSDITSNYGDITITGTGGSNGQTASNSNVGVYLATTKITSNGSGDHAANIAINGAGGVGDVGNHGVRLFAAEITSRDGDISITGTSAASPAAYQKYSVYGIYVGDNSRIISTGTNANAATISLHGVSSGTSRDSYGFGLNNSQILSSFGDIAVTGINTTRYSMGYNNRGILISNAGQIRSIGTGDLAANITMTGVGGAARSTNQGVYLTGLNTLASVIDGDLTITGTGGSNGQTVNSGNYGVIIGDRAELRSTGTGAGAGNIVLNGTGGTGGSTNYGIHIRDPNTKLTTMDGDIVLTGLGGVGPWRYNSASNIGIYLLNTGLGALSSMGTGIHAGNIILNGTGGSGRVGNHGINITSSGMSTVDGLIELTGISGPGAIGGGPGEAAGQPGGFVGSLNYGVFSNGSTIQSTGTGPSARGITLNGTGVAAGERSHGVMLSASSLLTAVDGDIAVTGTAGGHRVVEPGVANRGIELLSSSVISSTGTGPDAATITLKGTGGYGRHSNQGVLLQGLPSITSVEGDITIEGWIKNPLSTDNAVVISNVTGASTVTTTGPNADITIIADRLSVLSTARIASAGDLTIIPRTAGRDIRLRGVDDAVGSLYLDTPTIAGLSAGKTMTIGSPSSGTMTITAPVFAAGVYDIVLHGSAINLAGGLNARRDLTFITDAMAVSGGNIVAPGAIYITPRTSSTTIGLGGGAGDLNLDDTELAFFVPATDLVIGGTNGTGAVTIDTLDVSARPYDLTIQGGPMTSFGGIRADGAIALTSHIGAMALAGPVTANGTATLLSVGNMLLDGTITGAGTGRTVTMASTQGNVISTMGLSLVDAGGGYFAIYSGTPWQSAFGGLDTQTGIQYNTLFDAWTGGVSQVLYRTTVAGITEHIVQDTGVAKIFRNHIMAPVAHILPSSPVYAMTSSSQVPVSDNDVNASGIEGVGIDMVQECYMDAEYKNLSCIMPQAGDEEITKH